MLNNKDKEAVLKLMKKLKQSNSLAEIREIEFAMKKIDFNNRKKEVVSDILNKCRK